MHPYDRSKGFSGKAQLLKDKREQRKADIDKLRCSVCEVPIMSDTRILWCPLVNCPRTDKRRPTKEEKEKYGIPIGR